MNEPDAGRAPPRVESCGEPFPSIEETLPGMEALSDVSKRS